MKLKGIELMGTYKVRYYDTGFVVYNEKGNTIYREDGNAYWFRREYKIYYKNSKDEIIDTRVKELTFEEIEKLLGCKIKIKGE
ncbi:MAG: hypothetical protein PHI22_03690 [Bacilli bacterium]|nr:hypothetical protein [Bacilli bacterium]MDY0386943.1 hypothetical protein [Methanolobus sp.]